MLPCMYLVALALTLVRLDAGDDYSLNWEQRLHIALDAAQGPYFNYLLILCIVCMYAYFD